MPLFLKSFDPTVDIFGDTQTFRYNTDQIHNEANLALLNAFTPTNTTSTNTGLAFLKPSLNGFRFKHEFSPTSIYGNFYLECASKFGVSSNIFKFDELTNTLYFYHGADMNNRYCSNLASGTLNTDAVNKGQMDVADTSTLNAAKNYTDTFAISPSRISGYPSNPSLFLNGLGSWVAPSFPNVTTTSAASYSLILNNTNASSTDTGFLMQNNGSYGVALGFNNSTNEGYVWTYGTASLKFGTANTMRAQFLNDGSFNILTNNWLRNSINTKSGIQVYGLGSGAMVLDNMNGESAGIGFDGSTDMCTIWTAGDSGSYLNMQDEDSANTRVAYVAGTGAWTVVSSAERKHSIKEKSNNNILDRFLQLSVKTYGYKYDADENLSEQKKARIERKTNKMATGLVLEELFDIFPNCIPDYYNKLFQEKDRNKKIDLANEVKDTANCGIDYNTLLCYFIMAFQEFAQKTNNTISELKGKK